MNSVALDSFDLHVYQPLGRVCGHKRESTMTDSLFWLTLVVALTALLWMPYILEFISRVGLLGECDAGVGRKDEKKHTPTL
jgi:hypothetical protein